MVYGDLFLGNASKGEATPWHAAANCRTNLPMMSLFLRQTHATIGSCMGTWPRPQHIRSVWPYPKGAHTPSIAVSPYTCTLGRACMSFNGERRESCCRTPLAVTYLLENERIGCWKPPYTSDSWPVSTKVVGSDDFFCNVYGGLSGPILRYVGDLELNY